MTDTPTEPPAAYFTARRFLIVALVLLIGAEFAGLGFSSDKGLEIGGTSLALHNPTGLVYLLVFLVAFAMYEHRLEWLVFLETGRPGSFRRTDYKLLKAGSEGVLGLFYVSETIRTWNEGWIPHALAAGFVGLLFVGLLWWRRIGGERLLRGESLKWPVRSLGVALLILTVLEPIVHDITYLSWFSIMLLPVVFMGLRCLEAFGGSPMGNEGDGAPKQAPQEPATSPAGVDSPAAAAEEQTGGPTEP